MDGCSASTEWRGASASSSTPFAVPVDALGIITALLLAVHSKPPSDNLPRALVTPPVTLRGPHPSQLCILQDSLDLFLFRDRRATMTRPTGVGSKRIDVKDSRNKSRFRES